MKGIYISISIAVLCTVLITGCHKKQPTSTPGVAFSMSDTMMRRCEFATVEMLDVKNELTLFGKIAADNSRQAHIYPIMSGSVSDIPVELGDYVKQGQVLATIQSSEVADFQRQLLDAQADVAVAEKNLQVSKDLYQGKINSERDVNTAEKGLEKANAELSRIQEVYSIYHLKKGSSYNIVAPISGFIVFKDITQNEQLRSDKSDIIFSIAQIEEVWVLANVNESNIANVAVGYQAEVSTISYPDKIFLGKVDRIFNVIDPETKAMKIMIRIQNPDLLLKPEMNATVILKHSEKRSMLAVPSSAVIFDKSKNWIMVFKDRNNIDTRQIEVYRQLGDVTYISGGLKEGEKVISKNGLMIYDALND
jgi:cobalt-zinc-cadmium efflux system membrane fusion protein